MEDEKPVILENEDNELVEKESLDLEKIESEPIQEEPHFLDELLDKLEENQKTDKKVVKIHCSTEKILLVIVFLCLGMSLLILESPLFLAILFFGLGLMALGGYIVLNPSKGLSLLKNGCMGSLLLNGMLVPI